MTGCSGTAQVVVLVLGWGLRMLLFNTNKTQNNTYV
jgi:hypothetical protein